MLPRRLLLMLLVPAGLILIGTVGFQLLEPDYSPLDALYLTVITLTTIGFGDVVPRTPAGKIFTMFLALGGIFTMFYVAAEVIRAVVGGEFQKALGRQRMEQSLANLHGHMIICGFGRMGRLVAREFSQQRVPFVVIEKRAELLDGFHLAHGLAIAGDAASDEVLKHARVERARALVTVLASDADNLYITLSARLLNDKLFIVARAEDDKAEQKLIRAGANRVVSPYSIGGLQVAHAVLRPAVVDFIELATRSEHLELQMEESRITASSQLAGISIQDSKLRQELGIIVVAIKKPSGHMLFNPPSDTVLQANDILITLGPRPQLDRLEQLAKG